ncbi:hypothetical protein BGZ80_000919 [Entomortierella chlamydospora]|uniref:Uncharacterized protein n=1 Tax=Entomortierella chlamydospora TaxID=101097 RepID=A0A9P6MRS7_9FUNG|nr:hypothetical protein BGZ80_000919 [Entomortierella chlamydospora]
MDRPLTIQIDGLRLHLLAFKLKELSSVRCTRFPPNVLPSQISSTTGGQDYYLTEIQNVVKTQEDVTSIWGCEPDQIMALGLDPGQASSVVKFAELYGEKLNGGDEDTDLGKSHNVSTTTQPPVAFHNLAVKQNAVYQPTFKYRHWLEDKKMDDKPGDMTESIHFFAVKTPVLKRISKNSTNLQNLSHRNTNYYANISKVLDLAQLATHLQSLSVETLTSGCTFEERLIHTVERHQGLEKLELHNREFAYEPFLRLTRACRRLRSLTIETKFPKLDTQVNFATSRIFK